MLNIYCLFSFMKTRETQPKQTREFSPCFILNKEKKTMKKTKKATPKKRETKKTAKKTIFSAVKNVGSSLLVSAVRTLSASKQGLVSIIEISEFLTDEGYPITPEQVRKGLQKYRRQFFSSKEEQKEMRGNGQVQMNDEVLGWRNEKPIAYGIQKGTLKELI